MYRSIVAALALAVGWAVSPSAASAQELRYQTFLVGERALGMGGAFTGVADDPSAAFYNPAGLAHLQSGALSGSLSVDAYNHRVVEDGYGSLLGTADLEHDARPSVPIFASAVYKFGKKDATRMRRHAFAISTFHPIRQQYAYALELRNEVVRAPSIGHQWADIRSSDTITWYGPSYAYRVSPTLAFGLSAFLSTREFIEEEKVTDLDEGPPDAFNNRTTPYFYVREGLTQLTAEHIVLRTGVLWSPADAWRVGLMVQPPGYQLSAESRLASRTVSAFIYPDAAGSTAWFTSPDQSGLEAESPVPWEVRAGASFAPGEDSLLALDVSVYGPSGSAEDPVRAIGSAEPDAVTGEVPQAGAFVAHTWYRRMTANVSVGGETLLFGHVPVRAGFFTNLSAAPEIGGPTNFYAPERVNAYGATLSVGIRAEGYDVSIGAAGLLGTGRGLRLNPDPFGDHPETYLPTTVRERVVYFFLSGAKKAASRLATNVYNEYVASAE